MTERQQPLFIEHPGEWWEFCGDTFEEHVDCWQEVDGQIKSDKWKLGAVAASLDTKYKDKTIERFAYETRRPARRIREYAQTYRAFENGGRAPILSFYHHTIAAKAENPVEAIQLAEDKEWSTRELQYWVDNGVEPTPRNATAKTTKDDVPQSGPDLRALHDKVVREELDTRIATLRSWTEPVDPFLSTVYRRAIEMLEWQRDRTVDRDCAALITMLAGDDDLEDGAECASILDMSVWLKSRCLLMSASDLRSRVELMVKLNMLQKLSRKRSKGKAQRGAVTVVYEIHSDYLRRMTKADEEGKAAPAATDLLKEREPAKEPSANNVVAA